MKERYLLNEGDAEASLREMADASVDCCVTSPPYYMLRDYGVEGQIGREGSPDMYIDRLVSAFRQVRRVLKEDGTLWVNIGDTYYSCAEDASSGLKHKDLIGIPWMLAFALRRDGWHLRSDIIWDAPNKMPESCVDRCSKCHEYIFMLAKSEKYYFDYASIMERTLEKRESGHDESHLFELHEDTDIHQVSACGHKNMLEGKGQSVHSMHKRRAMGLKDLTYEFRRKRSVWHVPIRGFKGAHFATFPEELVEPCVLAGCRKGGVVLDPFAGSGTAGVVALRLGRRFVGVELNHQYAEMAKNRLRDADMQLQFDI